MHKISDRAGTGVDVMALYRDHVLPCLTHLATSNRQLIKYRRRVVSQARGRVLEIGIGSGLNLSFYGGQVASVYGIDPSAGLLRQAGRQSATRAELVKASAEIIPFGNDFFDTVVTTWTLCTIPRVIAALRESGFSYRGARHRIHARADPVHRHV